MQCCVEVERCGMAEPNGIPADFRRVLGRDSSEAYSFWRLRFNLLNHALYEKILKAFLNLLAKRGVTACFRTALFQVTVFLMTCLV